MAGSIIVNGARTPIGKLAGSLAGFSATDLGGLAIAGALARAGITGEQVDYVYMGQVLLGGAGQAPARQAAVKGGVPMTTPSAIVTSPRPAVIWMIARTMASSCLSSVSLRMNDWSIFSRETSKRLR